MNEPAAPIDPLKPFLGQIQQVEAARFDEARRLLIEHAGQRLEILTRRMLRNYPRLRRWEQTGDVLQNALLRLYRALESVRPATAAQFYALAATQVRRELIDLARHHFGPEGEAADHHTDRPGAEPAVQRAPSASAEPENLAEWTEFHEAVERLPEAEREVFQLLWYDGIPQDQAAEILGVSVRTIKSRWRNAKLLLRSAIDHRPPS